ncbi:MAG: FliI/YscN family ATPase [Deltaproteobacteria bacterium]|nr:FliI/YscN family ATPase [Deltaproteobacteria bacterium]
MPAPIEVDLGRYRAAALRGVAPAIEGRLSQAVGLVLEAQGCAASIGDLFELHPGGGSPIQAEVVGLRGDSTLLMPLGATHGLEVGTPLRRVGRSAYAAVGEGLLGRVVDGLGRPLDGRPLDDLEAELPLHGAARNPLRRRPVKHPFLVGVRAIDGLLTMGRGQRIGIFAGGGVGKSSLLGMMVRNAEADVAVIALIGERGREVEEFVHATLGDEGLARSVVVAATSADTPLLRVRGALYATTIAEYFRGRGLNVLLVMDSVTRYAMAMREIGLAIGEPPTTKGYTPSVFASLPLLLERAGTSAGPGAITGVYTVLVEGDDLSDPIADAARAILDGHIVLSRDLAERGHFPAIDLGPSISRVMPKVVPPAAMERAHRARELLSDAREAHDLMSIGAYKAGAVPRLDEAAKREPALIAFLRQHLDESLDADGVSAALDAVWSDA